MPAVSGFPLRDGALCRLMNVMRTLLVAGLAGLLIPASLPAQAPKKKIQRAADLPVFQYPMHGSVEDRFFPRAGVDPDNAGHDRG